MPKSEAQLPSGAKLQRTRLSKSSARSLCRVYSIWCSNWLHCLAGVVNERDQGILRGAMDPAEMIVPVFGIAAAAAVTFYAVSFMEMSEKSFENLGAKDREEVKLRSSQSAKERRQVKSGLKEQSRE
ncbi:hypothetical protein R1flu_018844 [Riccia fluitans]|uniref:Uncharacterized protein n=1 Tax=Riccia fluitans TaxID=41844 RepID=A0ABD1ZH00_9MARC